MRRSFRANAQQFFGVGSAELCPAFAEHRDRGAAETIV
jgi:hypothetical protein